MIPERQCCVEPWVIYLVSPQPWHGFRVSKHHYAIELALRGHRVYFIENALTDAVFGRVELYCSGYENLTVVRHAGLFTRWTQYRFPTMHALVAIRQIRRLIAAIGVGPSVVWDFDNNCAFPDLSAFGKMLKIFHPVDSIVGDRRTAKGADVVVSVSADFINRLPAATEHTLVLPHGISRLHEAYAKRVVANDLVAQRKKSSRRTVGYVGNLDMVGIDWSTIFRMITHFQDVEFVFVGPFGRTHQYGEGKRQALLTSLRSFPNVRLTGLLQSQRILELAAEVDVWLFCNDSALRPDGALNSHKLLEYMATGKAVLSSSIRAFDATSPLVMALPGQNEMMIGLLGDMLANIETINRAKEMRRRASFALDFTYGANLDRIGDFLDASRLPACWTRCRAIASSPSQNATCQL